VLDDKTQMQEAGQRRGPLKPTHAIWPVSSIVAMENPGLPAKTRSAASRRYF
jgi:hypothetical protein